MSIFTKERLEVIETDIPGMYLPPKHKPPHGKIIAGIAALAATVFIGLQVYWHYQAPTHHKIQWSVHHPTVLSGKPLYNKGYSPVKEGTIRITASPLKEYIGDCLVYKQNDRLTLQAYYPNTMRITADMRVGERVTEGCSEAYVRLYQIKCCWIDE